LYPNIIKIWIEYAFGCRHFNFIVPGFGYGTFVNKVGNWSGLKLQGKALQWSSPYLFIVGWLAEKAAGNIFTAEQKTWEL
jgi:hypothetical protein